jgi:hypothetical protein
MDAPPRERSWTIELDNTPDRVDAICGPFAAGCHTIHDGKPYAIVDTSYAQTHRIWSVAASHEVNEMWVDPWMNHRIGMGDGSRDKWLVEVSDPVEDYHQPRAGVQILDFVTPEWYREEVGQQDDFGRIRLPREWDVWQFSCTTGIAFWHQFGGGWHAMTPPCSGAGPITHGAMAAVRKNPHSPALPQDGVHARIRPDHSVVTFPVG